MTARRTVALVPLMLLAACATGRTPELLEQRSSLCDRCEIVVENQTTALVTVFYYGDGSRRVLGDITANSAGAYQILRPVNRDRVTLVVGVNGRDWCRGVVELPGRMVVGDVMSCKPDRLSAPLL